MFIKILVIKLFINNNFYEKYNYINIRLLLIIKLNSINLY